MRTIFIEEYNLAWPEEFEKIKDMLHSHISDLILDIQHVGSTSIPGLPSKPVLDFNIIIESYTFFPQLLEKLAVLGYRHDGDGGITQRERIKNGVRDGYMDYNMYVCPKDSVELMRQLAFRDYLRTHPSEAREYGKIKIDLANQFPHDIDSYIAGKHSFIEKIVENAKKGGYYEDEYRIK